VSVDVHGNSLNASIGVRENADVGVNSSSTSADARRDSQTQLGIQYLCENFGTMSADPATKTVDVAQNGWSEVVTGNVHICHHVGYNIVSTKMT
jgi:hypothetical protein